jgi:aminopeptidase C
LNSIHEGLNILVHKKIVEKIIAHLLLDLDSDNDNLNSNHTALSIFQLQEEDDNNEDIDINSGRYLISISNQLQYQLIVKYIAAGLSFRQCYTVFMDMKETQI